MTVRSLAKLQAERMRALAAKAGARDAYLRVRDAAEAKGVPRIEDDPLVERARATYAQAEERYAAARSEHSEAVEAARKAYERGDTLP